MTDLDLNASDKGEGEKEKGKRKRLEDKEDMQAISLNVGKAQGFFPGNLMEIVNRNIVGSKPDIGRIDLKANSSVFDVRKEDARRVVDALKNVDFFGVNLRPTLVGGKEHKRKESEKKSVVKGDRDKLLGKKKADAKTKQEKGNKENKKSKNGKPEYNGSYEIFYKKKK